MRFTVNYSGALFTDDNKSFNTHWTDSFEEAARLLYQLRDCGFNDAYLKDEEYQCTLRWDAREKEFVWEG